MPFKAFVSILLSIAFLYVIDATAVFMFGIWSTVEKKAELVYYYGSGVGAMLVGGLPFLQ
ncbi:hypothetical protein GBZ26_03900 [Azospirillum formosense]|uniref:Uncharacterized protein n=1 Tax=Azospirillum formosense TaxID=861533 RepID=A0ABX2KSK5_9PROT|nr:hypothetical protein [Azospirillum formosense]MBY3755758.1 hypothetical protein [Azospirillum formosense]NUB18367.1 hypothetical protein [Azospirillum formosense]